MSEAQKAPLVYLLRQVPKTHRLSWQEFNEDGSSAGYHLCPIGRIAHEVADVTATLSQQLTTTQAENEALWETFVKVADYLGIDNERARKIPGKPSQVFFAAVIRKQAEAVESSVSELMPGRCGSPDDPSPEFNAACEMCSEFSDYAQRLRQQADEVEKQPNE